MVQLVAVIAGFGLLAWGADRFVIGSSATARNLGVSPLVIGLTIVGFGTSAPEVLVSAMAAWQDNAQLAVGNALGSNIANVALVLGATALICPLLVRSETLRREYPLMFAVMLLSLVLMLDSELSRGDGLILLAGLAALLYGMVSIGLRKNQRDPLDQEFAAEIPTGLATGRALLWIAVGLAALLVGSRLAVWGAAEIALALGVSDLVVGLTIVAVGTSLPELAASVTSALRKEPDIAIGNIIGSNMFNLLAVLGIAATVRPMPLTAEVLTRDMPIMIGVSIVFFAMAYGFRGDGRLNRVEGALLLAGYTAYIAWLAADMMG